MPICIYFRRTRVVAALSAWLMSLGAAYVLAISAVVVFCVQRSEPCLCNQYASRTFICMTWCRWSWVAQGWSKCIDVEREKGGDYPSDCREQVTFLAVSAAAPCVRTLGFGSTRKLCPVCLVAYLASWLQMILCVQCNFQSFLVIQLSPTPLFSVAKDAHDSAVG